MPYEINFQDENGDRYGIKHIRNKPRVSAMPYLYDIAEGNVSGHTRTTVLGYRSSVTVIWEDLSQLTYNKVHLPSAVTDMEVVSTRSADASGGTGATQVEVHGLDGNYAQQSELVTLAGTSAVPLTNQYIRINNFHVMQAGDNEFSVGDLTIFGTSGATVYHKISAGNNMGLQAHFTIPAGVTGYVTQWNVGMGTPQQTVGRAALEAKADYHDRSLVTVFQTQDIIVANDGTVVKTFALPLQLPPKCDVKIRAQRIIGSNRLDISGSIEMWYEDA